jgi:UDP-N-acetylenolpyruvoylglucosamine reductase
MTLYGFKGNRIDRIAFKICTLAGIIVNNYRADFQDVLSLLSHVQCHGLRG